LVSNVIPNHNPDMKAIKYSLLLLFIAASAMLFSSFFSTTSLSSKRIKLAYKKAGLNERQAAAHLLNRFAFGATPGEVDEVVKMGLENWLNHQLNADMPEDSLTKRLSVYHDLYHSNTEVLDTFPIRQDVYNRAARDGYVSKDSINVAKNKAAFNAQIRAYMKVKGYKSEQDLYTQFNAQKIIRATYSNNQLQEVMTDFWFNHFNVSFAKNGPGRYIPAYERDIIRPNVFGKFDKLLLATAKSPAMLYYLDNAASVGPPVQRTQIPPPQTMDMTMGMTADTTRKLPPPPVRRRNAPGLNENYAREVMELHTLGVDGGYTQTDVTQAARVLTGWTMFPEGEYSNNNGLRDQFKKNGEDKMTAQGYWHDGDFLFNPTRHDKGEKTVLGHHFDANGGYPEGEELLEMLAHHPSAAKFITRKIAVRFVSDNPPQSLLDKMAKSFTEHDGDIREVLITMVGSPEFWDKQALCEKTKSPFELAISSVRGLNGDITEPLLLNNWIARMGERLYYYLAPTGFPDKGAYWINTGSLLNRMNFGLQLASGRLPGVVVNLAALNNNQTPESPEAALAIYSKLLLPERDLDQTIKRLTPMLHQNDAPTANNDGMAKAPQPQTTITKRPDNIVAVNQMMSYTLPVGGTLYASKPVITNNPMLAQVVGIIIGSPEYQRR